MIPYGIESCYKTTCNFKIQPYKKSRRSYDMDSFFIIFLRIFVDNFLENPIVGFGFGQVIWIRTNPEELQHKKKSRCVYANKGTAYAHNDELIRFGAATS